ncbi:MAG TPA: cation diffusion facilitator family transporter [Gammaproteobacteria bacterium]|nr:cation diffusion facilitator family transporter [Gammaproteobacteria bacterium]
MPPSDLSQQDASARRLRRVVLIVALANLAYFFVEFAVAKRIGSVSLFADSIDFLEDTSVNLLIVIALGWSLKNRARVGMLLAAVLLIPTTALIWTAWKKFQIPTPPEPWLLSITGFGALAVNLGCAFLLTNYRHHRGSLTRAAFLSARNDALANLAIIGAGIVTLRWMSGWPDLIVGLGIALLNADAAKEIWHSARAEHASALP